MNVPFSLSANETLSTRRKAAMIVQMLINDGSPLSLAKLPEPLQELLTRELGAIRMVDRDTVAHVAEEFVQEVETIGLAAAGTQDGAVSALADHLSPDLAYRLRQQTHAGQNDDRWPEVTALSVERLIAIMMAESVEIGAIVLSKLSVTTAAEVLSQTPGDRARRISLAISRTENTSPDAVQAIGFALAEDYGRSPALAFEKAPVQRLGAILNATKSDRREDLLESLGEDDPVFAGDVRKAIFTFKDIVDRLKPLDVPNCTRTIPADILNQAIAAGLAGDAALQASAEFILENLSQRMSAQIREDVAELPPLKPDDADAAMTALTTAIRTMVDNGELALLDPDQPQDTA